MSKAKQKKYQFKSTLTESTIDESDLVRDLVRLVLSTIKITNEEKSLIQERITESDYKNHKTVKENAEC